MRVLVLGSGVIGITTAYYLAQDGHEVTVLDRQPGPALETSFANAGEISPGYSSPWAAPGIPAEGAEVALHAPPPARHLAEARPGHDPLGPPHAPELHRRPLRAEQGPHGAARRVQPRPPARAPRRAPASPMTSAPRARCSCSAPRRCSTARPRTSPSSSASACPTSSWTSTGCIRVEPALARVAREDRGRPAPARRRDRRLLLFTRRLLRSCAERRRPLPLRHHRSRASSRRGDRIAGV